MVYYLNPSWEPSQGGELRIYTKNDGIQVVSPVADTLAMFWSDQIVHDVLPTMNDITAKDERRYALTLWLVSDNQQEIVNPKDPLYPLRQTHFPSYE
jgi:Rps23 Pro-64 3,4-dihydroxylase Tpa1-like proline 4-hydroxylase